MRDLLVLAIFYGSLPAAIFRPFIGLCVMAWISYLRPQDLAWGLESTSMLSHVFMATALGLAWGVLEGREVPLRIRTQTILLIGLMIWSNITLRQAISPAAGKWMYQALQSAVIVAVLTTGLTSTWKRLRGLWIIIAFSLGLLGFKYAVYSLARGGTRFEYGPGGFMSDNNAFAMALNVAIPLLMAIALTDKSKWIRVVAMTLVPLCMITIILTFSRGGLLTLGVVGALLIWRSGRPIVATMALLVGLGLFWATSTGKIKDAYVERAKSISEYEEDRSMQGRFTEWKTAWRIAADYPIFGVGPNNLRYVHSRYSDNPGTYKVSHNSFLQLLVDSGYPALVMLTMMLVLALWRLQLMRAEWGGSAPGVYAAALQTSLVAWMVGGSLLNMAYFDLLYHMLGLTVVLEIVGSEAFESTEPVVATESEQPWWRQPRPSPGVS